MKLKALFIAILIIASCKHVDQETVEIKEDENKKLNLIVNSSNVKLEVYNFKAFEKFLNLKDDKVYVINFWATWCAPCVKELPYFEKLNELYNDKNVEVILVSLDFPHLYDSKLKPFIKERKLISKVIALDDVDMNTWIPKVDDKWSGSIPATIIYRNDNKKFFERSFTYEELELEVMRFIN
ncbi:thioredoxin [Flavivirga aquatica]|uniref:Thioredoxin n=1 Tax=Flavivirga aquatica TaxID=1849968 RepID=A0A1E5SIV4_9FLAO|nr:TlpA disulfide reductase family protein [Flavivirga aquatica]OEJ99048.1 thioredoxin [Flavivirga aquatica]